MNHPAMERTDPVITLRGDDARSFMEAYADRTVFVMATGEVKHPGIPAMGECPVVVGILEGDGGRSWFLFDEHTLMFYQHGVCR